MNSPPRRRQDLLAALSDGRFHSGGRLAADLGISRSAVWKHVQALRELGLEIFAVTGKGYRLAEPTELLDADGLQRRLQSLAAMQRLEVHGELDSTNNELLRRAEQGPIHGQVLLAEFQHSGRGRRGRSWLAPLGSGVCLSLGWEFEVEPATVASLSLAAGVAVVRALESVGVGRLGLKWPNDVWWRDRKLAGVLLDLRLESGGRTAVVIGVGINYRLPESVRRQIPQPCCDVLSLTATPPSRNDLAAAMIRELIHMAADYQQGGFAGFLDTWRSLDVLRDRAVVLELPNERIEGWARDVDEEGGLLLAVEGTLRRFAVGEVSLRPQTSP